MVKPQKPTPVIPPTIKFHVLTTDNQKEKLILNDSYMSLTWNDYLTLGQYFKEINRYIKETQVVLKHYENNESQ